MIALEPQGGNLHHVPVPGQTLLCTELLPQAPMVGVMKLMCFVSGVLGQLSGEAAAGQGDLQAAPTRAIPAPSTLRGFWSRTVTVALEQPPLPLHCQTKITEVWKGL